MYLAAYMEMYALESEQVKVGGKVVFNFEFDDELDPNVVYNKYIANVELQNYINNVKEVRGAVYRLMKQ
jgi:hypothetical protein